MMDNKAVMVQKFCPVYNDRIVTPKSPSVMHEGKKVYLFNKSAVRRWERGAERAKLKGLRAGVLPQFEGNEEIEGKVNKVAEKAAE